MRSIKTSQCKRCGSTKVAWHQSKNTGRWYLAFAVQASSRSDGAIYPWNPHACDDPLRGGYDACPLCGEHHHTPFGVPDAEHCTTHQNRNAS